MKARATVTTITTAAPSARRLGPGEYVFRAVLVNRQVVQVVARTFAGAVHAAGELTGSLTGDDLLALEVDDAADRLGFHPGKAVPAC